MQFINIDVIARIIFLVGLAIPLQHLKASGSPDFCKLVFSQFKDFDVYGGFESVKQRETMGDLAVSAGMHYLATKVSIDQLPDLLASRYSVLDSTLLNKDHRIHQLVGSKSIGESIDFDLGGLILHSEAKLESMQNISGATSFPLEAGSTTNVFVLYSPRVLSLVPWSYGSKVWLHQENKLSGSQRSRLCKGWDCITSASSRAIIESTFVQDFKEPSSRYVLRTEDVLPRYEILGVIIQKQNAEALIDMFEKSPGLSSWQRLMHVQNHYPAIDPMSHRYFEKHLLEVAEDINPSVSSTSSRRQDFNVAYPLMSYSPKVGKNIRSLVLENYPVFKSTPKPRAKNSRLVTPRALISGESKESSYGLFQGYSLNQERYIKNLESSLKTGKLPENISIPLMFDSNTKVSVSKIGRIEIHGIKKWKLTMIEYTNGEQTAMVLMHSNGGKVIPPTDAEHPVLGIAKVHPDNSISWVWSQDIDMFTNRKEL